MPALTPTSAPGSLLAESKLIAVLVIDTIESAVPVASVLLAGGVHAMPFSSRSE
ncbi:MAG: hypothetical protein P1U81_12860 [Verrucomicrobiales bacterium]|nr:hypothetical protein [bacterium]MDF2377128.1 hypothetical protein [Verrucomicrobiales bacterium]